MLAEKRIDWLFAAVNLWATFYLCEDRGRHAALWFAWIISAAGGLLTHYFFLFAWTPACVWLLLQPGGKKRAIALVNMGVACALIFPWYRHLPAQMAAWRLTGDWLKAQPENYHAIRFYLYMPYTYFSLRGPWGVRDAINWGMMLVWAAVFIVALRNVRGKSVSRSVWLPLLVAGGMVGGVALFDLWRHTYAGSNERYFAAGLPAAVVVAGVALSLLRPRFRRVLTIIIVLGCLWGELRMVRNRGRNGQAIREAAAWVHGHAHPDDLVIVQSIPSGVAGFARYLDAGTSGGPKVISWVPQLNARTVEPDAARFASGKTAVFIVRFHDVGATCPEEKWFFDHARHVDRVIFERVDIDQFVPNDQAKIFDFAPATSQSTASRPVLEW